MSSVSSSTFKLACVVAATAYVAYMYDKKKKSEKSMFMEGNFGPVNKEVYATLLPVTEGSVPEEIDGSFIRNGPNPQFAPEPNYHWFEGDGMLHGVRVCNGQVSYRNKFIETEAYLAEKREGHRLFGGLLNLRGPLGVLDIMWNQLKPKLGLGLNRYSRLTANTSVVYHSGYFFALMEADQPFWVQSQTLSTVGRFDYDGKLYHSFTAHPKVDPITGEMVFFGYNYLPFIFLAVVSKDGEKGPSIKIDLPRPVMMHDFAITQHYSIILDLPAVFDVKGIMLGKTAVEWDENGQSRIGVIERHAKDGSTIRWFNVSLCYVFHTANAWEEGDEIVLIASRFEYMNVNNLSKQNEMPYLHMWRLNMKTGEVVEKNLTKRPLEFPTINESYTGSKNRYVYGVEMESIATMGKSVIKYDVQNEEIQSFNFESYEHNGEFVFVPREKCTSEDDGWLLGFVFSEKRNNSDFVILNAKDMTLQARVALPQRVPYGFHGKWLSKEMLTTERSPTPDEIEKYTNKRRRQVRETDYKK